MMKRAASLYLTLLLCTFTEQLYSCRYNLPYAYFSQKLYLTPAINLYNSQHFFLFAASPIEYTHNSSSKSLNNPLKTYPLLSTEFTFINYYRVKNKIRYSSHIVSLISLPKKTQEQEGISILNKDKNLLYDYNLSFSQRISKGNFVLNLSYIKGFTNNYIYQEKNRAPENNVSNFIFKNPENNSVCFNLKIFDKRITTKEHIGTYHLYTNPKVYILNYGFEYYFNKQCLGINYFHPITQSKNTTPVISNELNVNISFLL